MCNTCYKILGPHCKPHEESACPLRKAMYCSICGKGKHFTNDCPLRSNANDTKVITSVKCEAKNTYSLQHKIDVYIDYLRANNQEFGSTLLLNRNLVERHLLTRGYILVNPYKTPTTQHCKCAKCIRV